MRGDYTVALREWRSLAEQGVAAAQSNLADMYKLGLGVPRDYAAAVRWYRKASEQGDAKAQHNFGGALYSGRGIPQDYDEAARWFYKASQRGNTKAQFSLGLMYAKGDGVARDDVQAYKWLALAASRTPPGKVRFRMSRIRLFIAGRMTIDQISEGRRLVGEWLATFQEARNRHRQIRSNASVWRTGFPLAS